MTNEPERRDAESHQPHRQQATDIVPAGGLFGGTVVVQDETPLWLAWETAKEAWLNRASIRPNTRKAYEIALRQFYEWTNVEPWNVSPALAQAWDYELREERELAASTVSQKLAALSSFYEFVQRRYVFRTRDGRDVYLWPADRANPFDAVERPKISPYGRAKFPTVEELQAILAEINTDCLTGARDFALLYTISTTCRRSSEILNLRWGDIQEMDDGNYCFEYVYKGGDARRAVMNRMAYQSICAYLEADGRPPAEMGDEDFVFIPLDAERIGHLPQIEADDVDPGQPISNSFANKILKKYARRVGVDEEKAHVHALRHAGARLRVKQMKETRGGVDYMELMELLGHSSLAVTQIYSQQVLEDPEDPGGDAAAQALLPKGKRRRKKEPPAEQQKLL